MGVFALSVLAPGCLLIANLDDELAERAMLQVSTGFRNFGEGVGASMTGLSTRTSAACTQSCSARRGSTAIATERRLRRPRYRRPPRAELER